MRTPMIGQPQPLIPTVTPLMQNANLQPPRLPSMAQSTQSGQIRQPGFSTSYFN